MIRGLKMSETILIVGASRGIGRSIASYLLEKGYHIVVVARTECDLQELISGKEENAKYIVCDISKLESIAMIFETIKEWNIILSGVVFCAGVCTPAPIQMIDANAMQRDMNINALSFVEMGKYMSKKKYMSDGGAIIAISSMSSWDKTKGMCAYSMSKSALNSAVQTMAKEFIKRKIRVNAILPAYVNTSMTIQPNFSDEQFAALQEKQPLGIIEPEYIAYMVEFLLSEKGKYLTGNLIPISAGRDEK